MSKSLTVLKEYVDNPQTQKRMRDILDKNSPAFLSSIISAVDQNNQLQKCDPASIMKAAFIAAAFKLPISAGLGFAHIVPYNNKAQFQLGWKGFVQLAIRSGQYKSIHVSEIYEDELDFYNPITGKIKFKDPENWFDRDSGKKEPVGFYARFELVTGFIKEDYKSRKAIALHAEKYSSAYKYDLRQHKKSSLWTTDFNAMANKTVLKLLLSKYGILSTDLQEAMIADQKIDGEYRDNPRFKDNDEVVEVPIVSAEVDKKETETIEAPDPDANFLEGVE